MEKIIRSAIVILSINLPLLLCSQNETSKWYFGGLAALDFMTTPPASISGSGMAVTAGCASIADVNGNLLFYTDGITVWNQQNVAMANGTGLFGNSYSTQSSIIIKQPGSASVYFVFTQNTTTVGLGYSIVDMSLAAGIGSVTVKNVLLLNSGAEKLTATAHCNGIDFWVASHGGNSHYFSEF